MPRTLLALATMLSLLAIALPSTAAASPTNDNFVGATVIDPGALPFSDSVDDSSATYTASVSGLAGFNVSVSPSSVTLAPGASGYPVNPLALF